jgi:hypothetical protein
MNREMDESVALFVGILTITTAGLRLTPNKHIAKIAALPSSEKLYYFRRVLLVGKCCGSRNLRQYAGR